IFQVPLEKKRTSPPRGDWSAYELGSDIFIYICECAKTSVYRLWTHSGRVKVDGNPTCLVDHISLAIFLYGELEISHLEADDLLAKSFIKLFLCNICELHVHIRTHFFIMELRCAALIGINENAQVMEYRLVQILGLKFDLDIYIDGKALSFVMLMNHKRLKRDFNAVSNIGACLIVTSPDVIITCLLMQIGEDMYRYIDLDCDHIYVRDTKFTTSRTETAWGPLQTNKTIMQRQINKRMHGQAKRGPTAFLPRAVGLVQPKVPYCCLDGSDGVFIKLDSEEDHLQGPNASKI
ncbi:hypothetical protein ACJX0J_011110, partial [Zea mays]